MKLTIATATAAILASAISVSAMTSDSIVKGDLILAGYDKDVVETLTGDQLSQLNSAFHNGSDSDARDAVASLMLRFAG